MPLLRARGGVAADPRVSGRPNGYDDEMPRTRRPAHFELAADAR